MPTTFLSEQTSALTKQLNYGTWRFQKSWNPLHIVDAEGCFFVDASGRRYLDLSSQLMCVNLGHKNQAVIEAIAEQARKLPYVSPGYATDARAELSQLLLEVLPEGLTKFFFTTSGTEANEAAFKIARMYTGKTKIIARYRSYHGSTMGSIAATGDPRRWAMEPGGKGQGFLFAPEVNCYLCPIKHTYPGCNVACVDYIEHMIENESDVAAVRWNQRSADTTAGIYATPSRDMRSTWRLIDRRRSYVWLGPHWRVVHRRSLECKTRYPGHRKRHNLRLYASGPLCNHR
jgi:taurine--2-oxoglutarate transaminase